MKGLLLKDCYTLLRQAKFFLLLIVAFALIPGISMSAFACVYAAMLPVTALAYDEQAKWDSLAAMMPYSKREIVGSKYLLGYCGILLAGLLSVGARLVLCLFGQAGPDAEMLPAMVLTACIAAIMLSVNLPIMFRYGVERGRIAFFVLIAVVALTGVSLGKRFSAEWSGAEIHGSGLLLTAVAVTVLIGAVSFCLAVCFYKRQDH